MNFFRGHVLLSRSIPIDSGHALNVTAGDDLALEKILRDSVEPVATYFLYVFHG